MGYICVAPKNRFSVVLDINKVLILAILVINRAWFMHSSLILNWLSFLEQTTFSSLLITPSTKALHKLCLGQLK